MLVAVVRPHRCRRSLDACPGQRNGSGGSAHPCVLLLPETQLSPNPCAAHSHLLVLVFVVGGCPQTQAGSATVAVDTRAVPHHVTARLIIDNWGSVDFSNHLVLHCPVPLIRALSLCLPLPSTQCFWLWVVMQALTFVNDRYIIPVGFSSRRMHGYCVFSLSRLLEAGPEPSLMCSQLLPPPPPQVALVPV